MGHDFAKPLDPLRKRKNMPPLEITSTVPFHGIIRLPQRKTYSRLKWNKNTENKNNSRNWDLLYWLYFKRNRGKNWRKRRTENENGKMKKVKTLRKTSWSIRGSYSHSNNGIISIFSRGWAILAVLITGFLVDTCQVTIFSKANATTSDILGFQLHDCQYSP